MNIKGFIKHPIKSIKTRAVRFFVAVADIVVYPYMRARYGRKNIIVLESAAAFEGNAGAIYRYMRANDKFKDYIYVWVGDHERNGKIKNGKNVFVFVLDRPAAKKKFLINHARFVLYDFCPIKTKNKNAVTVYLTHGCPGLKNAKGFIVVPDFVDRVICTSPYVVDGMSERIGAPKEKMFICGLPRNDVLYEEKKDVSSLIDARKYDKIILWMPTFRGGNNRNDSTGELPFGIPLVKNKNEFDKLNFELDRMNTLLLIKPHPAQDMSVFKFRSDGHIALMLPEEFTKFGIELYSVFVHTDALITDYSSVSFDYMLLDKPIAYTVDDLDDYKLRFSDEYYETWTAGEKIKTLDDLIAFCTNVHDGNDTFKEKRKEVSRIANFYHDGNNSARVIEMLGI